MFSTLPKTKLIFLFKVILSSVKSFILDWSKILLFGKGLKKPKNEISLYNCYQFIISRTQINAGTIQHHCFLWEPKSCMPNSLPYNDNLWCLLKTLLEKGKMMVTSIFFFSDNVLYHIKEKLQHLSYNEVELDAFNLDSAKIFFSGEG